MMTSAKIRLLHRIELRDCFEDSITNLATGQKRQFRKED